MNKSSKYFGVKTVHLLKSNEDKGNDQKKFGFNIETCNTLIFNNESVFFKQQSFWNKNICDHF